MHLNHPDAQVCTKDSLVFFQTLSLYFMLKVVQLLNVFTPERNLNDFQTLYVEKILLFEEDDYFFLFYYTDILYSILLIMTWIESFDVIYRSQRIILD
jgi:hypothetical protein